MIVPTEFRLERFSDPPGQLEIIAHYPQMGEAARRSGTFCIINEKGIGFPPGYAEAVARWAKDCLNACATIKNPAALRPLLDYVELMVGMMNEDGDQDEELRDLVSALDAEPGKEDSDGH